MSALFFYFRFPSKCKMNKKTETDSYFTLDQPSSGLYKDRGSKFLYFAFPVENEDQIKNELTSLKKTYFDASHHCFAWILGPNGEQFRANDDGEPNHSAGDPILGQIRSRHLTNVLLVVVRYFGGTKLGVSGLIQAYKTSAQLAIEDSQIIEKQVMKKIEIHFTYSKINEVMKIIKAENLEIRHQELNMDCRITLELRAGIEEKVTEKFKSLEGLTVRID
jgi:uncharacterized YigZ family protein